MTLLTHNPAIIPLMKPIQWNKVTKFSQIVAIILFVCVFYFGFYLGGKVRMFKILGNEINNVQFQCADNKSIHAIFYKNAVHITLSTGLGAFLHQTISASGARYANDDEMLVFWNKGDTAFVTEGVKGVETYSNCELLNV